MKKLLTLLLCFVLLLSLCACGGQETPSAPEQNEEPPVSVLPDSNEEPSGEVSSDDEASADAEEPTEDMVALVRSYIDKPLSELIAVIGEPESSDYVSSCLGDGEDGMLFYDGFIVYTYREGDSEVVYDVE